MKCVGFVVAQVLKIWMHPYKHVGSRSTQLSDVGMNCPAIFQTNQNKKLFRINVGATGKSFCLGIGTAKP